MHLRTKRGAAVLLAIAALALVMVAPRAEAARAPEPKIIGGDPAEPGEYPFMAALLNDTISGDDWNKQYCGGSLISSSWVLTAAHCVEGEQAADLAVAVGRNQLRDSTQGERRDVAAIYIHPQYGSPTSLANDAALLQLAAPITNIAPVRLAVAADDGFEAAGTILTVIGWGNTTTSGPAVYPNDLQEVDVPVVSDSSCARAYGTSLHAATMLCAGEGGKDSCQGDSGGPLFWNGSGGRVQMGIVSWGQGCAKKRFPGVYSEVNNSGIRSWITATSGV